MLYSTLMLMMSSAFLMLRLSPGGSFPRPLSEAEERKYLEAWLQGDLEARNVLIERNLRLVAHIIKKYYTHYNDTDDLISIGTIGLIKGINTYRPDKGVRLATYASKCAENEILMYFRSTRKNAAETLLSDALDTDGDGNSLSLIDILSEDEDMDARLQSDEMCQALRRCIGEVLDARERFENVSVDLMCGVPGQTPEMFEADVQTAVDLGVTHVSVYPLTIEDHTPFRRMVDSGEIDDVDQDKEALMMSMAPNVLTPAGFHRYEVASYAREGFECKHNLAYWTGVPYLGLGISAVTMTQNDACRMRVQDGEVQDDLNRKQMCAEDLMMKMRMTRGVSDDELFAAAVVIPGALDVFNSLVRDKLVKREDGRWKPTFGGWLLGNELYGRIYELAP